MDRLFGGNPLAVLVRLAIISLVVGIVMAALGIDAFELVERIRLMIWRVYDMGFDAVRWAGQYFLLGAAVVFPIWLVVRLLKLARGDQDRKT